MSAKSALPIKVIKHWFRNTLFKERQRNKDSPYNFNIPPSIGIDLDMYEKTGEAKIISLRTADETKEELAAKEQVKSPTPATTSASVNLVVHDVKPAKAQLHVKRD